MNRDMDKTLNYSLKKDSLLLVPVHPPIQKSNDPVHLSIPESMKNQLCLGSHDNLCMCSVRYKS